MKIKTRIAYSWYMIIPVILDAVFFRSGVISIGAIIIGYFLAVKGPEMSAVLEREGLHPRALLRGKVTITEEPVNAPELPEPEDTEEEGYYEELDDAFSAPDGGTSSDLDGLEDYGFLKPGADFVLAVQEDGTFITMKSLSSVGIGGRQGVGKTVSTLNLVTQAIPKYEGNIRFLVIDPHMNIDPDSEEADNSLAIKLKALDPFLLRVEGLKNPVAGGDDLAKWLTWIEKKRNARLGKNGPSEPANEYIVVVADEFAELSADEKVGRRLTEFLFHLNEEARKVKMFAIVSSNTWKASRMGGTDLRNSIATFIVHNMPSAIAGQIVDPDMARHAHKLKIGEVLTTVRGEEQRGAVPFAQARDLEKQVEKYKPRKALPMPKPRVDPASSTVLAMPHASYEEGLVILRLFDMLVNFDEYKPEEIIVAVAVRVYGPADGRGEEKVRRVLELREKHGN